MSRKEYDKILKKYYGYDGLKDLQYEIIDNIINGTDTIALLPTSYGKSICFQLPHIITKKNVIVVSPLISLMEDQMQDLKSRKIGVICLNSHNKNKTQDLDDVYEGESKIIYTTPEYLIANKKFIDKLVLLDNLALIAIDECHCISSWGHDFRNAYQKLSFLKEHAPDIPILALSATATDRVVEGIKANLNLVNPEIVKHSMDRKNLYIEICEKTDNVLDEKIVPLIEKNEDGRILIYCKTTADTDKVAEALKKYGYKCESYHAKKKDSERTEIQKQFTNGDINIIVSTIAFGMGINIPDIRILIHYNCSNDIESYVQEIGRAGRDNKTSRCYMFYSERDFMLNYLFLDGIKDFVAKKQKEVDVDFLKKYV